MNDPGEMPPADESRTAFLQTLLRLQTRVLDMSPDTRLPDVLRAIAAACNDALGGNFCVVQPYDAASDRFLAEEFTAVGLPDAEGFHWGEPRPEGATRAALRDGLLVVEDYGRDAARYPFLSGGGAFTAAAEVRAAVGVRLEAGANAVGVLFVIYLTPHAFTEEELDVVRVSGNLAALAIRNARLLESNRERELTAVLAAAAGLIRAALEPSLELDGFMDLVIERARELVPFDGGWLMLREGDRVCTRASDPRHRPDVGQSFPLENCVSGLSILRGEVINIGDLQRASEDLRPIYKGSRVPQARPMRSELAAPLMIGNAAIGALNVESEQPNAFGPRQVETLRLLSAHTALAVQLARSRQEARALAAIGMELARETELAAVVRLVLEHALSLAGARFGQLLLLEGPELVVRYTTNVPPRDLGLRVGLDTSVSGLAAQERRAVIVHDVGAAHYVVVTERAGSGQGAAAQMVLEARHSGLPRYRRVLGREKEPMRAELATPLWLGGEVVGVVNVETAREEGFSEVQRSAVARFAGEAGERFAAAYEAGDERALQELLAEALAQAETHFGQLLALNGNELIIVKTTGSELEGTRVRVLGSVSGQAALRMAPFYVPDVDREPLYQRYLGDEMKSELAVPMIGGDEVLGVLNVESPVPQFFTLEHAHILQALAGQAAVAIERARRTEIERLAAIGGLAGDIVHRLNNPLGALGGWLEMLKRKPFYGEIVRAYPYVEQYVKRAERDLAHARSIVQELRAELRRQSPEPVDLAAAVNDGLRRAGLGLGAAAGGEAAIQVVVELPPGLRVVAGRSLSGVLWNLFDNARKAMPGGGRLTVTADADTEPGWARIEVADTGSGIEPWRLPHLFDAAESTTTAAPGEGGTAETYAPAHGLGLWWARSQVESYGGTIEAASAPGEGTRITVKLRSIATGD